MKNHVQYRIGKSKAYQGLMIGLASLCVVPLVAVLGYVIKAGITKINWTFLSDVKRPIGEGGGVAHALVGSMIVIIVASLIAIPIGILCGIYLSENKTSRVSYWTGLSVDVLQGVPSIVIGIVAYIWLVKPFGHSALSGSIALAIMMFPIIVRSTEETLKMLPDTLREAAYALGMPFHRVVLKVILPCGISGIMSGVMLSVARVAGETAPLLFTAFGSSFMTTNVTKEMETLPHLIYDYSRQGIPELLDMAWGASCILLLWVLLINILTRFMTRKWKVQL